MIRLTRMGGKSVLVNEDWLESVEENPDTTLVFASGNKIIVLETAAKVLSLSDRWHRPGPAKLARPRRLR